MKFGNSGRVREHPRVEPSKEVILLLPYGLIIWIAGAALVVHFNFATEASWKAKVVVSGLALFSFASYFGWIPVRPLVGMFLLVAVSIFIIFYRMVHDATSGR